MHGKKRSVEDQFFDLVESLHPLDAISHISALLTFPEMGANAYRLELIASEIIKRSVGKSKVNASSLHRLFSLSGELGAGQMEDPAEDIFLHLVFYNGKNYRIFEGLWEQNGFILQRFLDVVDGMPNDGQFEVIKRQITSILTISEELANCCALRRYCAGDVRPRQYIPNEVISRVAARSRAVRFSKSELHAMGIHLADLSIFGSDLAEWKLKAGSQPQELMQQSYPLLIEGDTVYITFPSSISTAIRLSVIAFAKQGGMLKTLQINLAKQYSKLIYDTPLFGSSFGAPIAWVERDGYLVGDVIKEVDTGTYFQILCVSDDFTDIVPDGFSGFREFDSTFADLVSRRIADASEFCKGKPHFRQGITILVACGWGRGIGCTIPNDLPENWRIELFSIDQLITLSWLPEFEPLNVIRLLDHIETLESSGIHINYINGFLNLYANALNMGHYLVPPHDFDGQVFSKDNPLQVMVNGNSLLQQREQVIAENDLHLVKPPGGGTLLTRRYLQNSYFDDDRLQPIYASLHDAERRIYRCVYEGRIGELWLTMSHTDNEFDVDDSNDLLTAWDAFAKWLPLIANAIECASDHIPKRKYHWHLNYPATDYRKTLTVDEEATVSKLHDALEVVIDSDKNRITTRISDTVVDAFFHPDNIAEQAILGSLVTGISELTDVALDRGKIVVAAVKNTNARQFHIFQATRIEEFVADSIKDNPTEINEFDDTFHRIGLGFVTQDEPKFEVMRGIQVCTQYLNNVVDVLWARIRQRLITLDRQETIEFAYMNLESINRLESRWNRTIRAVLALHGDDGQALSAVAKQKYRHNANNLMSRILIEMAICECPVDGSGNKPTQLELSRLMSLIAILIEVGGWSDGIKHGAHKAEVTVNSLGLILVDGDFHSTIVRPFAEQFEHKRLTNLSDKSLGQFSESDTKPDAKDELEDENDFDPDFHHAWVAEYGFSLKQAGAIIDAITDLAHKEHTAIIQRHISELTEVASKVTSDTVASAFLCAMTLHAREKWDGFDVSVSARDVVPWRYRRELSLINRPIARIHNTDDAKCYVSPRLLWESFSYRVHGAFYGLYDASQFESGAMKSWIGTARNRSGHAFTLAVADRLKARGWDVLIEIDIPELLQQKLEQDFGDIDILAWRSDSKRVLAIECKDVHFAKTPGEISRQLKDFRGENYDDGSPDRLRRHINRIQVLQDNWEAVEKYIKVSSAQLEPTLLFKNPVPMTFLQIDSIQSMQVLVFDQLADI